MGWGNLSRITLELFARLDQVGAVFSTVELTTSCLSANRPSLPLVSRLSGLGLIFVLAQLGIGSPDQSSARHQTEFQLGSAHHKRASQNNAALIGGIVGGLAFVVIAMGVGYIFRQKLRTLFSWKASGTPLGLHGEPHIPSCYKLDMRLNQVADD